MKLSQIIVSTKCDLMIINEYEPLADIVEDVIKHNIQRVISIPKHIDALINLRVIKQGQFKIYALINYPIRNDKGISKFNNLNMVDVDGFVICIPKLNNKNEYYTEFSIILNYLSQSLEFRPIDFIIPDDINALNALNELNDKPEHIQITFDKLSTDMINKASEMLPRYVKIKPGMKIDDNILNNYSNDQRYRFNIYPNQISSIVSN